MSHEFYVWKRCLLRLDVISEYSLANKKTESFAVLTESKGRPYRSVVLLSLSWLRQLAWDVRAD
jgi:hypothetical protein